MRKFFSPVMLAGLLLIAPAAKAETETAIFAGGCFWCVEKDMDHVRGVLSTTSGYAGGTAENPTYKRHDGYREAVKVEFDNTVIGYEALTAHFLRTIDVTDGGGQFCDRGESYSPALFPLGGDQKKAAAAALKAAEQSLGQGVAVKIGGTPSFVAAEDYHQNYHQGSNRILTRFGFIRQSDAYARYRKACGRDARVKELWGKDAYTFPAVAGPEG
jgi:peptide-methionine (S)-S-oxide reductase